MSAEIAIDWDLRIPMRDGINLSSTLYRPLEVTEPAPAILILTPYVGQAFHEQASWFARHGYPFLTVDVRGRGNSEGTFHPAGEGSDGHDAVEWIAHQPFCNGKVAMWGGSYSGYVQWATAAAFPPHLATIAPVASPYRGVDSPHRHNHFSPYLMRWLTYISGRTAQDRIFADQSYWGSLFKRFFESGEPFSSFDRFIGTPSDLWQEWVSHPCQGHYWDSYNPPENALQRMNIPILTITGCYDGDQPGALAHYRAHEAAASEENKRQHFLVIGPWDHAGTRTPKGEFCGVIVGPESLIDLQQLHLDWWSWTMRDGTKPDFLKDQVAYYVMGAERWRYASSLDAITETTVPLYLSSNDGQANDVFVSGRLIDTPPQSSSPDIYVYDPLDTSLAELESTIDPESRVDHRLVYAGVGKHLIYHSAPFEVDTEISGFFRLEAWLSIDQPDTDFSVAVHEVGLDGKTILLSNDMLRARYRESLRHEVIVETDEPQRYDFKRFMFISKVVKRGHRLRLIIGPLNSIYWQKNYNSGGGVASETRENARTVNVRLYHDSKYTSALYVPFGSKETCDDHS